MKIFIFAYNRYSTMTTPALFRKEGVGFTVLIHSQDDYEKFLQHGTLLPTDNVWITNNPRGLSNQRNAALGLLWKDEWALFVNDDLTEFTQLGTYDVLEYKTNKLDITPDNCNFYDQLFNHKISVNEFVTWFIIELIPKAEKEGINLIGFSRFDNPLFRKNKWMYNVVVDGKCFLVKKTDLRWDENVNCLEDICFTTLNIKKFGKTLENRWIMPICKRLSTGGFGTKKERIPELEKEVKYLVETYPEHISVYEKKDWPVGTCVKLHNNQQTVTDRFL